MYQILQPAHSYLRYAVLILLILVIAKSLMSWLGKKAYDKADNGLSLGLFIATHLQLTLGLILYFISPQVQFVAGMMKDKNLRYWAVEHISVMLIAIIFITLARITAKRMEYGADKHKRMFIFNFIALVLIIISILSSGRPLIG
jgi:Na+-driven multidrug efflux pump